MTNTCLSFAGALAIHRRIETHIAAILCIAGRSV